MMARKKRVYEDDDGRTIADMRGVTGPSLFVPRGENARPAQPEKPGRFDTGMTRKERRMYVLGAMKAAMLMTLAYLVGLGAVIALLLWLWK